MLHRIYHQISVCSKMVNQATSLGISTGFSLLRQNHSFPFNFAIVRPLQVDRNLHSQLIHNSSYIRFFSCSRVVHSKACAAMGTGGDPSTTKKKKRRKRIKRPNKLSVQFSQAQEDLCDYLHCTRGYAFPDADHMSKNAPGFLQNLLSKLQKGGFNQSIGRLLRFQPINEFEPFFESIGLDPIKYKRLLPKNLIYLTDDPVMLDNYNILCNYGVPRSKIGEIFLEAGEVFRYGEGVLNSKIRRYENIGLSRSAIVKLISSCPHILIGEVDIGVIQVYEKLSNLGLDFDSVILCLPDKSRCNWSRVSEMLTFLYKMGFDKDTLATLIKGKPVFVFHESGKNMYLLVGVLIKVGLRTDGILNLFVKNPHILIGKFVQNLAYSVIFLTEIGMKLGDIASIISTHSHILGSSLCDSSDSALQRLGLSQKSLSDMIKADPSKFASLACTRNVSGSACNGQELFQKEKMEFLQRLGFTEYSDEMAKVVSKIRARGDKLQERFECLVNSGLDYHDVVEIVKTAPAVLNQSVELLRKKVDYLTSELNYPLEYLVDFPMFLCYNMDRMRLRFEMVLWLAEKGVVPKRVSERFSPSTVLICSEKRFTAQFVDVSPEFRKHYEMLRKSISGSDGTTD